MVHNPERLPREGREAEAARILEVIRLLELALDECYAYLIQLECDRRHGADPLT